MGLLIQDGTHLDHSRLGQLAAVWYGRPQLVSRLVVFLTLAEE